MTNLQKPWTWYPLARSLKRHIIFHAGPTNTGKTFAAMKKFMEANSGVYCGPLRLLAVEMANKVNMEGIPCDMLTGEEKQWAISDNKPASHSARTVEMCPVACKYDCAVIDEIQMLRDRDRGHAWTRAFLGVCAKHVHVCGEIAALPILQKLATFTGDSFEVKEYTRKTPLIVERASLGSLANVGEGDCVVCFSQKEIFRTRSWIEQSTGLKTAVVYGSLPPAVRVKQAEKFNDSKDKCKVLVASDAIGMGLNLNIKRIVFTTLEKFDGIEHTYLTSYHTKQIAGRAGRYGSRYPEGKVTTLHQKEHSRLKSLMKSPHTNIQAAGLWPKLEQFEMLATQLPNATLSELMVIADLIEPVPMSLKDRYTFCQAPVSVRGKFRELPSLLKFAEYFSRRRRVRLLDVKVLAQWRNRRPETLDQLQELESIHEILNVYRWLSNRYKDVFCDLESVIRLQQRTERLIQTCLPKLMVKEKRGHNRTHKAMTCMRPGNRFSRGVNQTRKNRGWTRIKNNRCDY